MMNNLIQFLVIDLLAVNFKVMGIVLLIGAGSAMGFYKAYEYKRRIADIIVLQNAFRLLETEIYYTLTPVPAALELLEPKLSLRMKQFFYQVRSGVAQKHLPLYQAWSEAMALLEQNSFLDAEELSAVRSFGQSLGTGDAREQQKNFQLLQQRLQHALEHAEQMRTQKARIWQYMGVCVSMAVALLLC